MLRRTGILAINERLAQQIRREAKDNPDSPYANRFVGLANGKVVVVADSLNDLSKRLRKIEPDPEKRFAVDVAARLHAGREDDMIGAGRGDPRRIEPRVQHDLDAISFELADLIVDDLADIAAIGRAPGEAHIAPERFAGLMQHHLGSA